PNRDNLLLPGAYVQVALPLQASTALTISANALLGHGEGLRVAVVDAAGTVSLHPIKVGRNFGNNMEVLEGVGAKDQLVLNPPDSLNDGDKVLVVAPAAEKAGGNKAETKAK